MRALLILCLMVQSAISPGRGSGKLASNGAAPPTLPTTNQLSGFDGNSLSATPVAAWTDAGPTGANLAATGTAQPTWAANQIGTNGAVTFNGTANVMSTAVSIPCVNSCTIYTLFKPAVVNVKQVFTAQSAGAGISYGITSTGNQVLDVQQTANIGTDTTALVAGTWYRLAATWTGGSWSFHVNGALTSSGTSGASVTNPVNQIGSNSNGTGTNSEFLNGSVALLYFYSGAYNPAVDTYMAYRQTH
jgi:hypothetical protein